MTNELIPWRVTPLGMFACKVTLFTKNQRSRALIQRRLEMFAGCLALHAVGDSISHGVTLKSSISQYLTKWPILHTIISAFRKSGGLLYFSTKTRHLQRLGGLLRTNHFLIIWQIWKSILKRNLELNGARAPLPFKQRAVHYYWTQMVSHQWKYAEDPIKSACDYLRQNEKTHEVKLLDLEEEPGTKVIAFTITDFMPFNGWTQCFLTDSTCEFGNCMIRLLLY
jgi:hypothetical protein